MLLVVWKRPNDTYYYRCVSGFYCKYEVGYENQYGHVIILVIDMAREFVYKEPILKKVLRKSISFLQRLDKNL